MYILAGKKKLEEIEEKISERHARTLLSLQDKAAQREWLHRVINERLTVRQLDIELKKLKTMSEVNTNVFTENQKFVDLTGLQYFWGKTKGYIEFL